MIYIQDAVGMKVGTWGGVKNVNDLSEADCRARNRQRSWRPM
jgi:hypothetical protein